MQDYTDGGSGGGKKSPMVIVLIVLAVMTFFGLACCGFSIWWGVGSVQNMERVYYPECEMLAEGNDCQACCRQKGYQGSIYGEFLNEEGKLCGCVGEGSGFEIR